MTPPDPAIRDGKSAVRQRRTSVRSAVGDWNESRGSISDSDLVRLNRNSGRARGERKWLQRKTAPTDMRLSRTSMLPDEVPALGPLNRCRGRQGVGRLFPVGATVLDFGSGSGEPSTRILHGAGLMTYAVDASPTMVAAYRERFPGVPIEQNTVEGSEFLNQTFSGVRSVVLTRSGSASALHREGGARARATGALPLHRAPAAVGMVGRCDRAPFAIPRRAHISATAPRCRTHACRHTQDEGGNHYYFVEKV